MYSAIPLEDIAANPGKFFDDDKHPELRRLRPYDLLEHDDILALTKHLFAVSTNSSHDPFMFRTKEEITGGEAMSTGRIEPENDGGGRKGKSVVEGKEKSKGKEPSARRASSLYILA